MHSIDITDGRIIDVQESVLMAFTLIKLQEDASDVTLHVMGVLRLEIRNAPLVDGMSLKNTLDGQPVQNAQKAVFMATSRMRPQRSVSLVTGHATGVHLGEILVVLIVCLMIKINTIDGKLVQDAQRGVREVISQTNRQRSANRRSSSCLDRF